MRHPQDGSRTDGPVRVGLTSSTLPETELRGGPRHAVAHLYTRCVVAAGGLPVLLPSVAPSLVPAYLADLDAVLLTGGLDVDPAEYGEPPHPKLGVVDQDRDRFEIALAKEACTRGVPVLGICRGVQLLAVAFGGTLHQHVPDDVPGAMRHDQEHVRVDAASHEVTVVSGTRLHAILGTTRLRVNSFHHQAVARVPDGFVATASTSDGVVEAMEDPLRGFVVGVQWHPERRPDDPASRALFAAHVAAARGRRDGGSVGVEEGAQAARPRGPMEARGVPLETE